MVLGIWLVTAAVTVPLLYWLRPNTVTAETTEETSPMSNAPRHCGRPMEKRERSGVVFHRCRCGAIQSAR